MAVLHLTVDFSAGTADDFSAAPVVNTCWPAAAFDKAFDRSTTRLQFSRRSGAFCTTHARPSSLLRFRLSRSGFLRALLSFAWRARHTPAIPPQTRRETMAPTRLLNRICYNRVGCRFISTRLLWRTINFGAKPPAAPCPPPPECSWSRIVRSGVERRREKMPEVFLQMIISRREIFVAVDCVRRRFDIVQINSTKNNRIISPFHITYPLCHSLLNKKKKKNLFSNSILIEF